MAVIKANSEDVKTLARLMRAEAEGEGEQGMLMVGNVGVNRILGNCLDFRNIRLMNDMVFQSPGASRQPRRVISTKEPAIVTFVWPSGSSMERKSAQRATRYGSFGQQENALGPGITRKIPDATRRTAFSVLLLRTVQPSISLQLYLTP